jgi:hypothetical protein
MVWQLVNAVSFYLSMLAGALIGMASLPVAERNGENGCTLSLLAALLWGSIAGAVVWKLAIWLRPRKPS